MSQQSTGLADHELALVVRPKVAMAMLDISPPTFYELLRAGAIESFKQGSARKVVVASIRKFIADQLAAKTSNLKTKTPRSPGRPRRTSAPATSAT
jgi:hypothetical protein